MYPMFNFSIRCIMPPPLKGQKPNKRRKPAKISKEPSERDVINMENQKKLERVNQAVTIRQRIVEKAGDILHEISQFEKDMSTWVLSGEDISGSGRIASASRNIEWNFHSDITKFPEVWIRSPDDGDDNVG